MYVTFQVSSDRRQLASGTRKPLTVVSDSLLPSLKRKVIIAGRVLPRPVSILLSRTQRAEIDEC